MHMRIFGMPGSGRLLACEKYSSIKFKKFPDSGAGNFSEPKLVSQFGRVREAVCA